MSKGNILTYVNPRRGAQGVTAAVESMAGEHGAGGMGAGGAGSGQARTFEMISKRFFRFRFSFSLRFGASKMTGSSVS